MKVKTWIPLVLAVVLGLAAAYMVKNAMSHGKGKTEDANLVATVTAAHDIEPGQKITPEDLATAKVSKEAIPAGSFQNPTDLVERVSLTRLVKGQSVLETLLAPKGTAAGVQALIPPGMRAITLQVNEFSGVAGLLLPGSKVDIISVIRNDENTGSVARTIVQNVEVRAIGRQITAPSAAPAGEPAPGAPPVPVVNNVTLLVNPAQAEAIQLSSVGGHPWLVLRNSTDEAPIESVGTSMADLRGDASHKGVDEITAPTKMASLDPFSNEKTDASSDTLAPKTRTVKFFRGNKEESMTVEVAPQPPVAAPKKDAAVDDEDYTTSASTDPSDINK